MPDQETQLPKPPSLSELKAELHELTNLVKSPGWVRLHKLLEETRYEKLQSVLAPLKSTDTLGLQEYFKGEANGLWIALTIASSRIEDLEAEIKQRKDLEDDDVESEPRRSP